MELALLLVVSFALIFANGFFVAAEFALISAPKPRLEQLAQEGNRVAALALATASTVSRQEHFVATSQLGLSLASLFLGMYAEHGLVGYFAERLPMAHPHVVASVIVLAFLTFWHIVLGELVPKSIGLLRAEPVILMLIRPMLVLGRIFAPLVWVLSRIGQGVLRLLRLPASHDVSFVYSSEELRLIMEESHEKGMLEGEEHELMQNVIDFGERAVRQVMVGRTRIVGVPVDATVDEALKLVVAEGYTRYPVYERDMDHIVGMVHVKDLIRSRRRFPGDRPVRQIKRDLPFVPETMLTDEVFEKMRDERVQMVVVFEENGGTAGLVTMEDLVEEVFGEVRDEFDAEEVEPITTLPDGSLRVQGDVPLEDVADAFDRDDCEWEGIDRVTGLVVDELGRPPRVGDVVENQNLRIVVESVLDKTVGMARVYNLAPQFSEEDELDLGT